ncbi:MAG: hypothetical protein JJE13_10775 [Thermoleophilia bacterium]|nr:hypothetical protein [Thermoleophilia bacterium]
MKLIRPLLFVAASLVLLTGSAEARLTIDDVSLRPSTQVQGTFMDFGNHGIADSGNEFVEPLADRCYAPQAAGGTVQIQLRNPGTTPLDVNAVKLNGTDLTELTDRPDGDPAFCDRGDVRWFRISPQTIPAGGAGAIYVNGPRFKAGSPVSFEVDSNGGSARVKANLSVPGLRINGIRFAPNLKRIWVFAQPNRRIFRKFSFASLRLNGRPLKARQHGGRRPGGRILVTAPLAKVKPGARINLRMRFKSGKRRLVTSTSLRAFGSRFQIGMGVGFGLSDLPEGEDAERLRQSGVDTLFAYDQTFDFETLLRAAHQGGFEVAVGPRIPGGDVTREERTDELVEAIPRLAADPAITTWIPFDEPDIPFPEPIWRYRSSNYIAGLADRVERADSTRPAFTNEWSPNAASEYGAIGDVNGWDHYILDRAPLALESALAFAQSNRAAVSPSPFWFWNQALAYGQARVPSAEETRVYTSLAVGNGATGLLWFSWDGENLERPLWPEMSAESRTLAALAPDLRNSVAWPGAATSGASRIDLGTVVSPRLAFLTVSNLDYQIVGNEPYRFTSRTGVKVKWKLPTWLKHRKDLVVAEVTPGSRPARLGRINGGRTLRIDDFDSSRWYVAAPRSVIKGVAARLGPG